MRLLTVPLLVVVGLAVLLCARGAHAARTSATTSTQEFEAPSGSEELSLLTTNVGTETSIRTSRPGRREVHTSSASGGSVVLGSFSKRCPAFKWASARKLKKQCVQALGAAVNRVSKKPFMLDAAKKEVRVSTSGIWTPKHQAQLTKLLTRSRVSGASKGCTKNCWTLVGKILGGGTTAGKKKPTPTRTSAAADTSRSRDAQAGSRRSALALLQLPTEGEPAPTTPTTTTTTEQGVQTQTQTVDAEAQLQSALARVHSAMTVQERAIQAAHAGETLSADAVSEMKDSLKETHGAIEEMKALFAEGDVETMALFKKLFSKFAGHDLVQEHSDAADSRAPITHEVTSIGTPRLDMDSPCSYVLHAEREDCTPHKAHRVVAGTGADAPPTVEEVEACVHVDIPSLAAKECTIGYVAGGKEDAKVETCVVEVERMETGNNKMWLTPGCVYRVSPWKAVSIAEGNVESWLWSGSATDEDAVSKTLVLLPNSRQINEELQRCLFSPQLGRRPYAGVIFAHVMERGPLSELLVENIGRFTAAPSTHVRLLIDQVSWRDTSLLEPMPTSLSMTVGASTVVLKEDPVMEYKDEEARLGALHFARVYRRLVNMPTLTAEALREETADERERAGDVARFTLKRGDEVIGTAEIPLADIKPLPEGAIGVNSDEPLAVPFVKEGADKLRASLSYSVLPPGSVPPGRVSLLLDFAYKGAHQETTSALLRPSVRLLVTQLTTHKMPLDTLWVDLRESPALTIAEQNIEMGRGDDRDILRDNSCGVYIAWLRALLRELRNEAPMWLVRRVGVRTNEHVWRDTFCNTREFAHELLWDDDKRGIRRVGDRVEAWWGGTVQDMEEALRPDFGGWRASTVHTYREGAGTGCNMMGTEVIEDVE